MKVTAYTGRDDLAVVYIAESIDGRAYEFMESIQPPYPREKKWVIIVSTLYGCPVRCPFCDAGADYKGKLSSDEIFEQIDYLVNKRFPDMNIPSEKFKIQFARMGDPAFNENVLDVLENLPSRYYAPGLMPCISTIAPKGSEKFFERLLDIKNRLYHENFQLQFSIHTTDNKTRGRLIPTPKWDFKQISEYGKRFYMQDERKITLNFALIDNVPVKPETLLKYYDPSKFLIKITPVNPTHRAEQNGLVSYIDPYSNSKQYDIINALKSSGYDVILSIGEPGENNIGSNCGQYLLQHQKQNQPLENGYTYKLKAI